jgi:hypothetical protein
MAHRGRKLGCSRDNTVARQVATWTILKRVDSPRSRRSLAARPSHSTPILRSTATAGAVLRGSWLRRPRPDPRLRAVRTDVAAARSTGEPPLIRPQCDAQGRSGTVGTPQSFVAHPCSATRIVPRSLPVLVRGCGGMWPEPPGRNCRFGGGAAVSTFAPARRPERARARRQRRRRLVNRSNGGPVEAVEGVRGIDAGGHGARVSDADRRQECVSLSQRSWMGGTPRHDADAARHCDNESRDEAASEPPRPAASVTRCGARGGRRTRVRSRRFAPFGIEPLRCPSLALADRATHRATLREQGDEFVLVFWAQPRGARQVDPRPTGG